jgi:hypothetical protein
LTYVADFPEGMSLKWIGRRVPEVNNRSISSASACNQCSE